MKKNILFVSFFAVSAIFVSNLFAQELTYSNLRSGEGISLNLSLNSYEITPISFRGEAMQEITLSGIFIPNDEGMPNLPVISRFVAIPKGAEVRVSIKSMETEILENVNIAPALRIQAIPEEPAMDYVKNESVYNTDEFYPQTPVQISEVLNLRGVNTIMVAVTPFQFNPVTKELVVINNIQFDIEYIGGTRTYDDPKYRSFWFDPILRNAVLNQEVLPEIEYTAKSSRNGEGCEYLIVIPNREDFIPYAEQIKNYRTKQGIYTKIMSLEEMGVTNTTQLKSFFHNAYNTWDIPPVAVLLMADHNTNMALGIPAEVISHPYNGSCITDNQYADVTGDKLPEMVFCRMAAETEAQMAVLVSKLFEYEAQPCMDPAYYQNPITALGWQTERWFQICSEVVGGYWRSQGKTPVRINAIYQGTPGSIWSSNQNTSMVVNYFGPTGTGYIPATPAELGGWNGGTPAQVVTAINNGAFALQHRDHGFENGWGEPGFQSSHISQLNNVGKMTYLFTINCLTGKFNHSSPCFGEVFHRYTYQGQNAGCVGFLGPTEVSYSFVNDAYAWGMYDFFDRDFMPTWGYSGTGSNYAGNWLPAFGNVSGKYFLAQSNWPYNTGDKIITYQMFTAHSDAFLRLYTEVPQTITATHADVALAGVSDFYITATEGTLIALTSVIDGNLEILDVATATGEMQTMHLPTTLLPNTDINVVITGQNFLRYEATVGVVPAEGPYIITDGYTVEGNGKLTYISQNETIIITLKNVGLDPTGVLNVTIACTDPKLTINNNTGTCNSITPNGTGTANFQVTVAHDIPDNKTFPIEVTITEPDKSRVWESKLTVKAFAPVFSLEKVLVNGSPTGKLKRGSLNTITTVIANTGGADAYDVKGNIQLNSQYLTIACEEHAIVEKILPSHDNVELNFNVIAVPDMPTGHSALTNLLISTKYDLSFSESFTVANSGNINICEAGQTNCSPNYKFTSVKLEKYSDLSVLLYNPNTLCSNTGYQDFTDMTATLEPGQQYTLKVIGGSASLTVRGWFDLNGNNNFDSNEQLINAMSCPIANTEYLETFTVPENATPGKYRFRLRCRYNGPPSSCEPYSYGQTHDYTFIIPEKYSHVQNLKADLSGHNITVKWSTPAGMPPTGYNIYRNGNKLNTAILTQTTFTEENLPEGIYVYNVTAVFGNDESLAEMSNVICFFITCEMPEELLGAVETNTAVLSWSEPKNTDDLLGYNIYRDDIKVNSSVITSTEYRDENLENATYIYKVSAVYNALCEESNLTEGVLVLINLGIHDIQTDSFNLFPNPTTGNVTIEGKGLTRVELYDIQGRMLAHYNNVNERLNINVNNYSNGVFFVKLYSNDSVVAVKRLVVIK
ncbi:MAG: C25 family cysteine peptidase [Bacteroidetes bacterium]|nr:C25 family cysteine peptidase [Bacteroidota bacterium]MCL1969340.1 C25 family cysteine peptidase [Bacteroidota bacterium]